MPRKSAEDKAKENLERVVRVVGGTLTRSFLQWGRKARFRAGKYTFTVTANMIYASQGGRYRGKTCFHFHDCVRVPHAEWQAAAILALRNKPALFLYWKNHPYRFRI